MTDSERTSIDLERLRELCSGYGADPARWPEPDRGAAQALLARDPEARRICAEAGELDRLLDALPQPAAPSAALMRKVAEIPLRHPRGAGARSMLGGLLPWRALLAAVLACALGVVSGALSVDSGNGSSDDGWDDVTTVAFAVGLDEGGP